MGSRLTTLQIGDRVAARLVTTESCPHQYAVLIINKRSYNIFISYCHRSEDLGWYIIFSVKDINSKHNEPIVIFTGNLKSGEKIKLYA